MTKELKQPRALQPLFVPSASWPIEPAALEALLGIGMSDGKIAEYFGVELDAVRSLRARYAME